jgi:hypothetical protein
MPTKYLLPYLLGITFAIPHKLNHELSDHSHYGIVAFDQPQIGQQLVEGRRHDGNLLGLERATFLLFFLNKLEKGLRWHDLSRTRWGLWSWRIICGEYTARMERNGTLPD